MCLFPACDGLRDVVPPSFCREWCREAPDSWLDESADLSCSDFNERLYEESRELAEFCSDEPVPDECEAICEFAAECGFPGNGCGQLCRSLDDEQRGCLANAEECGEFFRCIDGGREDRPDPRELCEGYCGRRSQCIFNECAPGTLPDGYTTACFESCEEDPLSFPEFQEFFDMSCAEVVVSLREVDQMLDARCDAEEEDACANVCADRVVQCMGITQEACVADCQNWDRANHVCVVRADSCNEVNACFGDPEGQELCRRQCDHLQTCLLEACPPRILPPTLTDGCTADCLEDPPSEGEVEQWEAFECRRVREFIYRGNRELRPLCDGGGDFRPTPEECVGFCDNALGACLGVGGRNFCLAGCASLTRDEYGCALEAQGNCARINVCLDGE